jgi:hypothetical protein
MQFPSDDQKALFSMKLGDRSSRTFAPGSRKIEITFKISEGLAGLRDKLQVFINKTIRDLKREKKQKFEFFFSPECPIVLVPSNKTIQSQWIELDEESFEHTLNKVWRNVYNNTRLKLSNNIDSVEEVRARRMAEYQFHFFAFIAKKPIDTPNRLSGANIEYQRQRINEIYETGEIPNSFPVHGGLAMEHFIEDAARKPRDATLQPPNDFTYRNLKRLDEERQKLNEERLRNDDRISLDIEINGIIFPVYFSKNQLLEKLDLPPYPIFDFNTEKDEVPDPDIPDREDVDHQSSSEDDNE